MDADALLGVWTGTARNSNGWEMKITISILQPLEEGSMLGVFDIPLLPCSGTLRVLRVEGETLELQADRLQGDCLDAESDSLEWLPDGTLQYISRGKDWETRGILERLG